MRTAGSSACGAAPTTWDLSGYRSQPGLEATSDEGTLTISWAGDRGQRLRVRLAVVDGTPTIRELAVRKAGGTREFLPGQ